VPDDTFFKHSLGYGFQTFSACRARSLWPENLSRWTHFLRANLLLQRRSSGL
jgi:hypothetical protein